MRRRRRWRWWQWWQRGWRPRRRYQAFIGASAGDVDLEGDQNLEVAIVVGEDQLKPRGELGRCSDGQPTDVHLYWEAIIGSVYIVRIFCEVRRVVDHITSWLQIVLADRERKVGPVPRWGSLVPSDIAEGEGDALYRTAWSEHLFGRERGERSLACNTNC